MKPSITARRKPPIVSAIALFALVSACALAAALAPGDPMRIDFSALSSPPSPAHPFGTDDMGRDLLRMTLHGGQASLLIGLGAAAISACIATAYGAASALAPRWLDALLSRFAELAMSLPPILYAVSALALLGKTSPLSLAVAIGATSWMGAAKVVHAETLQARDSEYIMAARLMGARFPYLLRRHFAPGFMPTVLYMLIHNVSHSIAAEATLSFLGIGLPPDMPSWGSLMSLAQGALLRDVWWVAAIPTLFLAVTLVLLTNIGECMRGK